MPNTITSYVTFVSGTKARASEVNSNFSNHRGDLLPVNENTATASDGAHDLGASDHFWKDGYLQTAQFEVTSTGRSAIYADTSGNLVFTSSADVIGYPAIAGGITVTALARLTASTTGAARIESDVDTFEFRKQDASLVMRRPLLSTSSAQETNSVASVAITNGCYSVTLNSRGVNRLQMEATATDARIVLTSQGATATSGDGKMDLTLYRVDNGVTSLVQRFPFEVGDSEATLTSVIANRWPVQIINCWDANAPLNTNCTYEFKIQMSGTALGVAAIRDCYLKVYTGI